MYILTLTGSDVLILSESSGFSGQRGLLKVKSFPLNSFVSSLSVQKVIFTSPHKPAVVGLGYVISN